MRFTLTLWYGLGTGTGAVDLDRHVHPRSPAGAGQMGSHSARGKGCRRRRPARAWLPYA